MEPNPLAIALLRANVRAAGIAERVQTLHAVAANRTGARAFVHACPFLARHATRAAAAEEVLLQRQRGVDKHCYTTLTESSRTFHPLADTVWTVSVEDLLRTLGVGVVDVLKVDCEGCERTLGDLRSVARFLTVEDHANEYDPSVHSFDAL